jgi:hypothetical protein
MFNVMVFSPRVAQKHIHKTITQATKKYPQGGANLDRGSKKRSLVEEVEVVARDILDDESQFERRTGRLSAMDTFNDEASRIVSGLRGSGNGFSITESSGPDGKFTGAFTEDPSLEG